LARSLVGQSARLGLGVADLAWISFSHGNIARAESRLEESADLFGELGDWASQLGLRALAFVRYNQGRLEEAAASPSTSRSRVARRGTVGPIA